MKYFKKFLILGLFALCGVSFCNATNVSDKIDIIGSGSIDYMTGKQIYSILDIGSDYGTYCVNFLDYQTNGGNPTLKIGFADSITGTPTNLYSLYKNQTGNYICLYGNKRYLNIYIDSTAYHGLSQYEIFKLNTLLSVDITCPDQYTSFQCQTEYNLIPIEDVTKNYCEINFDLIDPIDCPSSPSSGSGDVQRSALYVNNVQYNGAPNLYVNINDLLDYSMTYVSGSAVIDVDGYKADTGYMSDILTIQEYHPSSEDFTVAFVSFLTYALPYVIVALFVLFIWKLIKKIFKS